MYAAFHWTLSELISTLCTACTVSSKLSSSTYGAVSHLIPTLYCSWLLPQDPHMLFALQPLCPCFCSCFVSANKLIVTEKAQWSRGQLYFSDHLFLNVNWLLPAYYSFQQQTCSIHLTTLPAPGTSLTTVTTIVIYFDIIFGICKFRLTQSLPSPYETIIRIATCVLYMGKLDLGEVK
jgi:hypothetical protein